MRRSMLFVIKQFHKNMTADNAWTGLTRLAKHLQWPQYRGKKRKRREKKKTIHTCAWVLVNSIRELELKNQKYIKLSDRLNNELCHRKVQKSTQPMVRLNVAKDEKLTVDGNEFQTFMICSTKNIYLFTARAPWFIQFVFMPTCCWLLR